MNVKQGHLAQRFPSLTLRTLELEHMYQGSLWWSGRVSHDNNMWSLSFPKPVQFLFDPSFHTWENKVLWEGGRNSSKIVQVASGKAGSKPRSLDSQDSRFNVFTSVFCCLSYFRCFSIYGYYNGSLSGEWWRCYYPAFSLRKEVW